MKIDGFLEIGDIPGDSERDGHEEHIQCHGIKWNIMAPYDAVSKTNQGRVAVGNVAVLKYFDKASVYLAQAVHQTKDLAETKIYARRTIDGETVDYLVITLQDTRVASYVMHPCAEVEGLIEEEVTLVFSEITFEYTPEGSEAVINVHTAV